MKSCEYVAVFAGTGCEVNDLWLTTSRWWGKAAHENFAAGSPARLLYTASFVSAFITPG